LIGTVGPRIGRTKHEKEWFVVRKFLKGTIANQIFVPPISIRQACPPLPDFVVTGADGKEIVALIEITEATDEADQREMTLIERNGQPTLLGTFGGRGAAANPEGPWAKDAIEAIKRKTGKSIFSNSHGSRHLIIYPNSHMSISLFDADSERKAISVLRSTVADEAKLLAEIANGCCVHILGKCFIFLDILGCMSVVSRACKDSPSWQP
jgi:hypothetical protein